MEHPFLSSKRNESALEGLSYKDAIANATAPKRSNIDLTFEDSLPIIFQRKSSRMGAVYHR